MSIRRTIVFPQDTFNMLQGIRRSRILEGEDFVPFSRLVVEMVDKAFNFSGIIAQVVEREFDAERDSK